MVHLNKVTVLARKRRWLSVQAQLKEQEESLVQGHISLKSYEDFVLGTFKDRPGRGAPKKITLGQEQKIVALATTRPSDHGIPVTSWTVRMLAQVAVSKNIIETISYVQVHRILKKSALTPA